MKTLVVLTAFIASSLFAEVHASDRTELQTKIEQTINSNSGLLPLTPGNHDLVRVSFRVNHQGNIEVLDIDYSDEGIKNAVMAKLAEINLESETDPNEIFYYQFSFEKI